MTCFIKPLGEIDVEQLPLDDGTTTGFWYLVQNRAREQCGEGADFRWRGFPFFLIFFL